MAGAPKRNLTIGGAPALAGLLLIAAAALVWMWGYWQAMADPVVVRYTLAMKDMAADAPPLRIVLITDTHAGMPDMPPARLRRIVAEVNALGPDLVVLGGDYVKGAPFGIGDIPLADALAPLHGFSARLGVVAVLGNNDCAFGRAAVVAAGLEAGGIKVLRNQAVLLPGVAVIGVDDGIHCKGNTGPMMIDFEKQERALGPGGWRAPVIQLSHEPAYAFYAPGYADVLLAGHTHGGQIFPALTGPVVKMQQNLPAARGMMEVDGRPLIVSSGAGTNNLPLRIGVAPEIVLLTLEPAPARDQAATSSGWISPER